MRPVVFLGPQRHDPNLGEALRSLGLVGKVATVTAGWQERESDDRELREHLEGRAVNLELYRRAGEVFAQDPELAEAHRARQDKLHSLQDLYILRLNRACDACLAVTASDAPDVLKQEELTAAVEAVRTLDAGHLARVKAVHDEFEARWSPARRTSVALHVRELEGALSGAAALAVAGGHVAVLLNRLRLFGIATLAAELPVIAWSAGAMALSERVVVFHDNPPHGPGYPEVLENGLGLMPRVVPLPHARYRLNLKDSFRVRLMARRFAPAACVPMDGGARLDWNGSRLWAPPGNYLMEAGGVVRELQEGAA